MIQKLKQNRDEEKSKCKRMKVLDLKKEKVNRSRVKKAKGLNNRAANKTKHKKVDLNNNIQTLSGEGVKTKGNKDSSNMKEKVRERSLCSINKRTPT